MAKPTATNPDNKGKGAGQGNGGGFRNRQIADDKRVLFAAYRIHKVVGDDIEAVVVGRRKFAHENMLNVVEDADGSMSTQTPGKVSSCRMRSRLLRY